MARPLRIEYPDAIYHVFNTGLNEQSVFLAEKYFRAFLTGLADSCARFNVIVHAYCLLKNQYHLIVRTPEANLSRFMRQVDGLYTQQFQRLRGSEGSLFGGRYKAVIVQPEKYLLPLSRYIHLRVRGSNAKQYPWSSYRYYTRTGKLPTWFDRNTALQQLPGAGANYSAGSYSHYVGQGVDAELAHFYGKKNLSSVMGDDKFRRQMRRKRSSTAVRGISRGANAKWRPACRSIVAAVAKEFKVSEASIYQAARGPGSRNVPRWVAMYLCQELSAVTLHAIARLFNLQRYGTVSTTVGKLKREFAEDAVLRTRTERLVRRLSKKK